jgi:hypothetical protein
MLKTMPSFRCYKVLFVLLSSLFFLLPATHYIILSFPIRITLFSLFKKSGRKRKAMLNSKEKLCSCVGRRKWGKGVQKENLWNFWEWKRGLDLHSHSGRSQNIKIFGLKYNFNNNFNL